MQISWAVFFVVFRIEITHIFQFQLLPEQNVKLWKKRIVENDLILSEYQEKKIRPDYVRI